ncbi:MAG: hypothetical protein R2822_14680 [Spirosomataceae bacterium]
MKNKHNTIRLAASLAFLLTLGACDNVLDVKPRLAVDLGTAYNSPEALSAALNGVYDILQSTNLYGRDLVAIPKPWPTTVKPPTNRVVSMPSIKTDWSTLCKLGYGIRRYQPC